MNAEGAVKNLLGEKNRYGWYAIITEVYFQNFFTQSAGAVKYTDCFSAEG